MEIPKSRGSKKAAGTLDVKSVSSTVTQTDSITFCGVLTVMHGSLGTWKDRGRSMLYSGDACWVAGQPRRFYWNTGKISSNYWPVLTNYRGQGSTSRIYNNFLMSVSDNCGSWSAGHVMSIAAYNSTANEIALCCFFLVEIFLFSLSGSYYDDNLFQLRKIMLCCTLEFHFLFVEHCPIEMDTISRKKDRGNTSHWTSALAFTPQVVTSGFPYTNGGK